MLKAENTKLVAEFGGGVAVTPGEGIEAVRSRRDKDIKEYIELEVISKITYQSKDEGAVLGLTREVCALKVLEAQLQAEKSVAQSA